jgi:diguanylate cyclase (GGDEF)-like protein
MPLAADGELQNLFSVLDRVAPQLRALAAAYRPHAGAVCESLRVALPPGAEGAPRVLSISLIKLDAARLMAVISDVTLEAQREQQGLERRLRDAAQTDSLTRMPNRAALHAALQRALQRADADRAAGPSYAVLFINCDRFRQINDALGHATGDAVLGMMAERLRATLRQRDRSGRAAGDDALAARIGGDEFAVLLEGLQRPDDAHVVSQRLLDALGQPYGIGARQIHCSISIGVLMQAQASGDADAVLQDASIAMVEAKRAGGARHVVFEPAMRQRAARRSAVEADLRRALAGNELFVVYQPVVALQDGAGECAGVEALVRWRHPSRGIVPPIEFIGVAEECGLIGAVGDFVLATACRDFVQWHRELGACAPPRVAVNLSRAQLAQPGWVAAVNALLQETGMPPAQLQLEVTESLAAQDETVQQCLHALKALGLTLALDDFGTGYSSLSSLRLLPVDTVKIDRSFVMEADTSAHHRVLIEATVRVAASLGMNTVAEGIETAAQADVLRQLGCDKGQGYLYCRPLPAADLVPWLTAAPARERAGRCSPSAAPALRPIASSRATEGSGTAAA